MQEKAPHEPLLLRKLRENWFILGLLLAVGLAYLNPALGAENGPLHTETSTRWGVALIFLLQGLTLPVRSLLQGATNLRLHLLIQAVTFLLLPLLGIGFHALFGAYLPEQLSLGLLFLCVLPSTIKTAIVFSSLAGGDAAAAIFSATLSSIIGVFATPLWVAWLSQTQGNSIPTGDIFGEIIQLLLAPLAVGLLFRGFVSKWIDPYKSLTNHIASLVVLFIVYAAFCNSIQEGVWEKHGFALNGLAAGLALLIFVLATALTWLLARLLRLSRPDSITAIFCAPQKTLASGAPLAKLIFAGQPEVGLILLPLLFYHPLQLFLGGLLISYFAPHPETDKVLEGGGGGGKEAPGKGSAPDSAVIREASEG